MWCQVFPANSKEVLTSLAVANSSLLVWIQQGGPLSFFMSEAVFSWRLFNCRVRITRLMEKTSPRFSGGSLQPGTHNRCRSQKCVLPSVFSSCHVNLCIVTWPALCLHQFFQLYAICVAWCEPQTGTLTQETDATTMCMMTWCACRVTVTHTHTHTINKFAATCSEAWTS